jgi:hypothetical protein
MGRANGHRQVITILRASPSDNIPDEAPSSNKRVITFGYLLDLVDQEDWANLLQGVQEYFPEKSKNISLRDKWLLAPYARDILKKHHQRWNELLGPFVVDLGITTAPLNGVPVLFEDALEQEGWFPGEPYEDVALKNAMSNLGEALRKGSKLTPSYAAELAGAGLRESYHAAIASIVAAEPESFSQGLLDAPTLPGDTEAPARRQKLLQDISSIDHQVGVTIRDNFRGDQVAAVYKAYSRALRDSHDQPKIDLASLVLETVLEEASK